ncbi:MAG TPA: alpha/beta hydrolase [Ruminiclostridium sp.]|nr:alpha/beta hydrolase [Ruminiclostridium sp.]
MTMKMMKNMQHLIIHNRSCDIYYWLRQGTGNQWALFFHGAGVDHRMFDQQIEDFDPAFNLIAWDARGHGASKLEKGTVFHFLDMVSDCLKIYERHHIEKAVLIGQSMGGNLAQEIACSNPEKVEKLVLIDCSRNTGKLSQFEKAAVKLSRLMFCLYPWKSIIRQSADACGNKECVKSYVRECFKGIGKKMFMNVFIELTTCLHEDTQFRFKQPVLLFCGADDRLGNIRKIAEPWAADDSAIQLHIIKNAGHNSNQDQPETVNHYIEQFLNAAYDVQV